MPICSRSSRRDRMLCCVHNMAATGGADGYICLKDHFNNIPTSTPRSHKRHFFLIFSKIKPKSVNLKAKSVAAGWDFVWDLRFTQWWCWGLMSTGFCRRDAGLLLTDGSKKCSAFIFKVIWVQECLVLRKCCIHLSWLSCYNRMWCKVQAAEPEWQSYVTSYCVASSNSSRCVMATELHSGGGILNKVGETYWTVSDDHTV